MANIPELNEEQIMQLQASGKLTPGTAEAIRQKQIVPAAEPVAEEQSWWDKPGYKSIQESMEYKPPITKENAEKFLADPNSPYAKNYPGEFNKAVEFYGLKKQDRDPATNVAVAPVEKVDVSQLALAPKPQAPAAPVDFMKQSGLGSALATQIKGTKALGEAQAMGADQQAAEFDKAAVLSAGFDDQVKKIREERDIAHKENMTKIEQIQKEKAAQGEINPNRYWEKQGTGGKVTSAIAIMLGALGGVMTGQGGNAAMDIINKAIDNDIKAQQDAYEKTKGKLADAQSTYAMTMNQFGDKELAVLNSKASALQAADFKLKSIAAKSNSGVVKAQADIQSGKIQEEIGKLNMAINMQVDKSGKARQATMGPGVEDPGLLPEDLQKRAVKMPNGLYKPAINEQAAKDINEVSIAASSMKNILGQMRELNNPALPYSEKLAKAEALKTEYILQKKTAEKLGVLSSVDKEMVESTLGNPGGWRPGKTESLIKLAEDNLDKKMDLTYSQLVPGYKPLKKTAAPDMRK